MEEFLCSFSWFSCKSGIPLEVSVFSLQLALYYFLPGGKEVQSLLLLPLLFSSLLFSGLQLLAFFCGVSSKLRSLGRPGWGRAQEEERSRLFFTQTDTFFLAPGDRWWRRAGGGMRPQQTIAGDRRPQGDQATAVLAIAGQGRRPQATAGCSPIPLSRREFGGVD